MSKKSEYSRLCPQCGKTLYYTQKHSLIKCINKNSVCMSCSRRNRPDDVKYKCGNANRGKTLGPLSEEIKRKISESERGKTVSSETIEKLIQSHLGKSPTLQTRRKLAKSSRKAWADGKFKAMVIKTMSKSSQKFLNLIEQEFSIKIEREFELQYKFFDGKYNDILIEVDSKYWHRTKRQLRNDAKKNKIAKENGYKLFRFVVNDERHATKVFEENINILKDILK